MVRERVGVTLRLRCKKNVNGKSSPRGHRGYGGQKSGLIGQAGDFDAGSFWRQVAKLASEILVEKIESTLPGQLGCRLVVPWRGVVMETMIDAFINVRGVGHMICL
jgi:hypothetical protein